MLKQLLALSPVAGFQSQRFFSLHNRQTAGNTLVTDINNVNAHLSNDIQEAHQLAGTVGQAGVNYKVATGSGKTMLNKASNEIDINIATGQWYEHLLAFKLDCPTQYCCHTCCACTFDKQFVALHQEQNRGNNFFIVDDDHIINETLNK